MTVIFDQWRQVQAANRIFLYIDKSVGTIDLFSCVAFRVDGNIERNILFLIHIYCFHVPTLGNILILFL